MVAEVIVAFSPLNWDGVPHRTRQILSRFATSGRVLVIEEPQLQIDGLPHWEFHSPTSHLTICRPHLPFEGQARFVGWRMLLRQLRRSYSLSKPIAWVATPLVLPLLDELDPGAIIYDCIDEPASPRALTTLWNIYETRLLDRADLVFTSGVSLYYALRERHPNVHCFPSCVDVGHFKQAKTFERLLKDGDGAAPFKEPKGQADLPHPRLGFYGALDQRIDFNLIDLVARAHPEWQIVLIGPVADDLKPAALPRHSNLHYLGPRLYQQLPAYLAGWDVALLPFVRNEMTQYLNPTTLMEYMAAGRLIVSTRVADVVKPYCDIVYVGHSPNTFIIGCEQALAASTAERAHRIQLMREALTLHSWQTTVQTMAYLIACVLKQRRAAPVVEAPVSAQGQWALA